ncbi:hypothetical protein Naga_100674g5 [Nannochloropsis gaditana]|uniref:Uncharacterized protein n=1 Tax=Nannochloropsis gaditana TaxID=72520 RepID=W7TB04_9STRA|nr:hypothetical protein Naga_100674g5 [Nannochloropsis gaditana]
MLCASHASSVAVMSHSSLTHSRLPFDRIGFRFCHDRAPSYPLPSCCPLPSLFHTRIRTPTPRPGQACMERAPFKASASSCCRQRSTWRTKSSVQAGQACDGCRGRRAHRQGDPGASRTAHSSPSWGHRGG